MTSIKKYLHHKGSIDSLISLHPVFESFKHSIIHNHHNFKWKNTSNDTDEWHAMVSFFGKSGYGKSSTINAVFGEPILKTSDISACTSRCDCLDFKISHDYFLSFSDFPGIGESEYKDREYLEMYKNFLASSNVVVYLLRADMRDYSIDEQAFKTVFPSMEDKKKVIIAVNGCDKIEPISRAFLEYPSPEQMANIEKKLNELQKIFKPHNPIIPYSAQTTWNLDALVDAIVMTAKKGGDIIFPNAERH